MEYFYFPLESLLRQSKQHPEYRIYILIGAMVLVALLGLCFWAFRKYFTFVFKSLLRNPLRTALASLAVMVLVFVVTLIASVLGALDVVMAERTKDLKAIVTERWQIPSQMPMAYAVTLEEGAARPDTMDDYRVKPEDSMTWQFYGGTLDPNKRTRENLVFMFAMEPRKAQTMMDDLDKDNLPDELIEKLRTNKSGVLMGRDKMEAIQRKLGDRFTLTGLNYKDINLEFEIVGMLPEGRYNQSAIMNRDYLNDRLEAYKREHNGTKHPLADKTLNLVWLRVPDTQVFRKVADQITNSTLYTNPAVKCETASSGIASWLDSYRSMIWGLKWLVLPGMLIIMALVISLAISISVRERRTEIAVLKVLGYGPRRILGFVLGEAMIVGGGGGFLSAALSYLIIHFWMGGIKFQIQFFNMFDVVADIMWWGLLIGGMASLLGSIWPALAARKVKVSDVFAKVA
jgi:putative ABC transport system permease protein